MELSEPKEVILKKEAPKESKEQQQQNQQKIIDLESKILSLTNENDKLKSMLKERNTEIDNLKVRVGSKDREIDELKTEIRKVGDKSPLDSKLKDLSGQIEIWRNKANLLEEQWEKEQKRTKDLQESRDKFEVDLKNAKNDLDQAKKLIAKLENSTLEIEKLRLENENHKKKLEELETLKKKSEELESKNKIFQQEIEVLKQKIAAYEDHHDLNSKEIEVWRKRCDDIEKEWGDKYKSLEFEMDELGLMTSNLKENEDHLAVLMAENENWKQKCIEIESEWSQKHTKILQSLEKLKSENDRDSLISTLFLLMIEIERLNVLIKLIETEKENENKMKTSRVEKEKKASQDESASKIVYLNEEINKWMLKCAELQKLKSNDPQESVFKIQRLEEKCQELERIRESELQENNRKIELIRSSQGNTEILKQKIQELELQVTKLDGISHENAFLKDKIRRNEEELDKAHSYGDSLRRSQFDRESMEKELAHKSEKTALETEIRRLKILNDSLNQEIVQSKNKYYDEVRKSQSFDIDNKMKLLLSENERLSKELEQFRNKYYEEVNKKGQNFELDNKITFLEHNISQYSTEKEELLRQVDLYKTKYYEEVSKKSSNSDIENKVVLLASENERLRKESEQYKAKFYEEYTRKSQSFELENKLASIIKENERLSKELEQFKAKYYEEFSKKSQSFDLENKLTLLSTENERLRSELDQFKTKYYEEFSKKSQSFEIENKLALISSENERLLKEVDQFKAKYYEEIQKKSSNYEIENKVAILTHENERLNGEVDYWKRNSQENELEKRKLLEQADEKLKRFHEETIKKSQQQSSYIEQDLKEKNVRLLQEIEDYKTKLLRLEADYKKYQENSTANSSEIMNLEFEIEMKNKKLKEFEFLLQEKNNSISLQSDHLNKENERLRLELDDFKKKYSYLELDTYKKGNFEGENQRKISVLQAELDRNSQVLSEKIKDNKSLLEANLQKTRDYEESLIKLKISENQMAALDSKVKGLIEEINAWRSRYENLERFKSKEMDELKTHTEAIRKSQLDREIRDLTIKHQNEKMKLEAEIKRMQGIIELQNGEINLLKSKSTYEYMRTDPKINKLEENFFLISAENERLLSQTQVLNEKIRELETNQMKLSEFYQGQQRASIETTKKSQNFHLESLQSELNATRNELEDWKAKARKADIDSYGVSALNSQVSDLNQKILILNKDQHDLIDTLNEKKIYIEKIKQKKKLLKQKLRSSLASEQNSQFLINEIQQTREENQKLKDEIQRLENQQKSQLYSSKTETYSLELKQDEINRLNVRIKNIEDDLQLKSQEIVEWQKKYYQLKSESQYLEISKNQEIELNELRKKVSLLQYESNTQNGELNRLREENSKLVNLHAERSHQEKEKKAFMSESEGQMRRINELTEEVERWKDKCRNLENSSADKNFLEKQVRDWEQKVNILLMDNENLLRGKSLLEQKIRENELNEHNIQKPEGFDKVKFQKLEEQRVKELEELHQHLEILKNAHFDSYGIEFEAERMAYETALTQMKNKIIDLEKTGALIMKETDDNKLMLAMRLKEIEEYRQKIRYYEGGANYGNSFNGGEDLKNENERLKRQLSVKI